MRSRVSLKKEPIDPLSAAWMKELRTHNCTRAEYAVDPYAEVYRFREGVYGILKESADGMGAPWMYLIDGPEKAMLIDTGFGIGDLKGLVEQIIGKKPLIVVCTHAHFDHCYGNCQFDKVYCHEYEAPYMELKQDSHIWDYLFDENGKPIWYDFDRRDIVPYRRYEIVPCPDGYVFDLGGDHQVELVHLAGHSAGHAGYLDKKNRILFCGDDFVSMRVGIGMKREGMPYREYCSVHAFYEAVKRLSCRLDEFDVLFPGHFIVEIESRVVNDMLSVLQRIEDDPDHYDFEAKNYRGVLNRYCYVNGLGLLAFTKETVR